MRNLPIIVALAFAVCASAAAQQPADAPPPPPANQDGPQPSPPAIDRGPISGGVFHQPTQAEVEQRERNSAQAKKRAQQQDREVDQLYKQLIGRPTQ